MDAKTLGWIQIVGGALALLSPRSGFGYGMMGYGRGMMDNWSVTILALLFIVMGVHHLMEKQKGHR